jgi:2'-5' RNA ligase
LSVETRIRAFLALAFPVAVTRRIAEEVARRKAAVGDARVAWVPAANLHVTLKFLGGIPEELVEGIAGRLKQVAQRHAPIEARARGLGAFPSPSRPNVLWVGVDGGEALTRLAHDVDAAMVELGLAKEERPFHAHITVGRVKEHRGPIDWSSDAEYGTAALNEIIVYESRTHRAGAEYVARARVPLGIPGERTQ